jgi:PAS domain S-box-containing protein
MPSGATDPTRLQGLCEQFFELSPNGHVVVSADGSWLALNDAFCRIVGYTREELAHRTWKDITPPEDVPGEVAFVRDLLERGCVDQHYAKRYVRKDGSLVDVELRLRALLDGDGALRHYLVTVIDLAERRHAEQALGRQERLLRQVIDLVPHFIFAKDEQSRFLLVNRAVAEAYGTTVDGVVGKSDADFSATPEEAAHFHEDDLAVIRGGVPREVPEEPITDAQGRQRWLQTTKIPFEYGPERVRAILGVATDITRRRMAEHALRESEARYRLIADNLADVIWTTDLAMMPTFISPSVFRLRGYTVEEAMALPIEQVLVPESLARARAVFAEEFAREGLPGVDPNRARSVSLEEYRKDGGTVWTDNEISFLRDAGGRAVGFVGVTRDVTQRRQLEDQLRQAQKMEAVGQLAGGVAHDFNNLLQVMIGYTELAMARIPPDQPPYDELRNVLLAGERAARLVAQLLAFGRRQKIVREAVDVTAVLRETATMLRRVIGEHLVLETEFEEGLPRVLADRGQLEQVLLNICLNARDAMPSGGALRISTSFRRFGRDEAVERPWAEAGSFVRIAVTDTGVGMSPEVLEHLFEPFFTTKEAGKGSGLGMAMVYGVVRQHEGLIHVDSTPGRGTTVEVYFPVVTPTG